MKSFNPNIIDFKPPQTWIRKIAEAGKPPHTLDELISTPIDFSAYVMDNIKIENLTQEHLVGPGFNLLKGTCKSRVELEYHFEECYKVVTNQIDWTNPEGHEYPFDLSKPLSLIENKGRQVVPANNFINNDLEYLKGGSSSKKYTSSTTKTKAANYEVVLLRVSGGDCSSKRRSAALQIQRRRVVILKRVEDLQLGVESYQKKLNIARPETF
nr:hypothetical protein [Tanacetum cinerariifolium]